jgi:hypothetical protein
MTRTGRNKNETKILLTLSGKLKLLETPNIHLRECQNMDLNPSFGNK